MGEPGMRHPVGRLGTYHHILRVCVPTHASASWCARVPVRLWAPNAASVALTRAFQQLDGR